MEKEKPIKVYVQVDVSFDESGQMSPKWIFWEDGARYKIDRVTEIRQAPALRCGGQGDRYAIWVGGKQSYLYFERNGSMTGGNIGRWFVERRVP